MERVEYTGLPKCLHRQTMYDWGRRGIRSRGGRKFRGSNGRLRCFFDTTWLSELERIEARSGQSQLLRTISRMTPEWIAVVRKRGKFWSVNYYLVPKIVASEARERLKKLVDLTIPF
jgi:hypothetical protein